MKTRAIKLNKGTGHFAFHLLEAGKSNSERGSKLRINSACSCFY